MFINTFYPLMCDLPTEECWVLLLNQASKVIDRVKNKCRWIGCYCCGYSLYLERGIDEAGCFDGTLS